MNRKRRIFAMGTGAALFGFVILNVLAYNHARAMTRFQTGGARTQSPEELSTPEKLEILLLGVSIPRPVLLTTPSDVGLQHDPIIIFQGPSKLAAWLIHGSIPTLVILFHGYSAEKSSMLMEAKLLNDQGYSCLLVDFSGVGESDGRQTSIGYREADDVVAAFRYARSEMANDKVILFGQSMGAAAILRAVHVYQIEPDGIVLEAVFDRLMTTIKNRFQVMGVPAFPSAHLLAFWGGVQASFNPFEHNPVEYAVSVNCPVLYLHGDQDPRAKLSEAEQVFNANPEPKWMYVFANTKHESYAAVHPGDWCKVVSDFIANGERANEIP